MVKGLKESVDSDTVRTIPCDAAFTLPIFGISLKRSLFSGLLDKVYLSVCKKEEGEKRSKDKAFNEHKS